MQFYETTLARVCGPANAPTNTIKPTYASICLLFHHGIAGCVWVLAGRGIVASPCSLFQQQETGPFELVVKDKEAVAS